MRLFPLSNDNNVSAVSSILVTGGAGYIGSHVVASLSDLGYSRIVVLDNLSTGFADAVINATFVQGDIGNEALLDSLFQAHRFDAVLHFAARTVIPESLRDPLLYYDNNLAGTLCLLKACHRYRVKYFIFSSTAAVYGLGSDHNITEDTPLCPIHPYGRSKWMSEAIIQDLGSASSLRYMILRYFNVAGADANGRIGQRTPNASHLIKVAVETACGKRSSMPIFGTDYPTLDGTCIRDYIHVSDLARAHCLALDYLQQGGHSSILNCGYGQGFSVKAVIETVETIAQTKITVTPCPRRQGDLARVVADPSRLQQLLHWQPQFDDLRAIVQSAYQYEQTL